MTERVQLLLVFGLVFAVFAGIAFGVHVSDNDWPWSPVGKARRARRARWSAAFVEYLSYGYDEPTARSKANERLAAEAKAADEVKP